MTIKSLTLATAGLLAVTMPMQVAAQDGTSTTTTERNEGFNPGWLGLLGLAGLLGLKRKDVHHNNTAGTTSNRI